MADTFDCVVIGAGIVGSWTAWQLVKRGKNVLLLEQFHLPTIRGSSHGQSRLIRTCYTEKYFSSMMPEAFREWKEMEEASGVRLFKNTNVLYLTSDEDKFNAVKKNLEDYAPEQFKVGDVDDFLDPKFINFPANYKGLLDLTGGALYAHKALSTVQDLIKKHGGTIRDGRPVTSIKNNGNDVIITTQNDIIQAHSLVVCAGAWTTRIFNDEVNNQLAKYLQPLAVKVYYWRIIKQPTKEIPSFMDQGPCGESSAYGIFGSDEYPGLVKVCLHGGAPCNPNERDKAVFPPNQDENVINYIKERFPMLDPTPAVIESCMYTDCIDETFIIDKVPTYQNVYVGCGFSGTGFKTAPVVGKLLCEMALGLPPSYNLETFALSRFEKSK